MLRVTWEWLGGEPALDVANTVAISKGIEHDMLAPPGEYERWAEAAARSSAAEGTTAAALIEARPLLLSLRKHIRAALFATAAGEPLPVQAVRELNRASRAAPTWLELDAAAATAREVDGVGRVERLLAAYARSAIQLVAEGRDQLRVCGAPSCGMFYRPVRERQLWCSTQCGTRARVARHYRPRRARARSS